MKAYLTLENGLFLEGRSFGAEGEITGEVVFNTGLTGYQEILTDPSYYGQIVTMTYPLIGNYGVNEEDFESTIPWVRGFIVKEYCPYPSNWRSKGNLEDFLKKYNIIGIQDIDTRYLTRQIRESGAMRGIISTIDNDKNSLLKKVKSSPEITGQDYVKYVSCKSSKICTEIDLSPSSVETSLAKSIDANSTSSIHADRSKGEKYRVAVYDFGVKLNILRSLINPGCEIIIFPADTPPTEILSHNPDGILLSNGPGDPAAVTYAVQNVKKIIGKKPIFGICLGHQILAIALGGKTYKLKFGHHGVNHPVKNLLTGKIEITVQNHGFAV
ncbi:MAG: glutamine-hydrolyzing carbamoyl-phosphate synthase small subunit, partial [Fidelibacterota bacterium]